MALTGRLQTVFVPKPTSDLERFLAGELGEAQDLLPVAIVLAAILLLLIGAALVHATQA